MVLLTNIIHFHAPMHNNIGDAAVVFTIKDLLNHYLKISNYKFINIEKLKNFDWNFKKLFTKIISYKIINIYDLCVIGGGGLYAKWFFPLNKKIINNIEIPIILYGIGNNIDIGDKELSKEQIQSIILLNKRAELSSVRDMETYQFLRNLNLNNIDVIGDPAIFLKTKKKKVEKSNKKEIIIGINIAHHSWKLQSLLINKVIKEYIKTCKFLIRDYQAKILYLKHTPSEDVIIKKLKKQLTIKVVDYLPPFNMTSKLKHMFPLLPIKTGECNPYELKYVYDTLDLVIGMHLHSAIFAFGSGIPVINISYNLKNDSFMKFIHQEDKLMRVDRIDSRKLYKIVTYTLDNSKEIKKDFKYIKNNIWKKHDIFLKKIQSL